MEVENLASGADDFTGNVWKMENDETVLVDAGTGDCWDSIRELESVEKVVLTHSHHDHVDNLPKVVERFQPEVYAFEPGNLPVNGKEVSEGDELELAGANFEIFHTPGHKDDSICLYSGSGKVLFTGDLVFPDGGFGRTDLEEGDRDRLIESIEKVDALDVEVFYPGHGDSVMEEAGGWIKRSLEEARKREPKYQD